jgi:hypothetical protein
MCDLRDVKYQTLLLRYFDVLHELVNEALSRHVGLWASASRGPSLEQAKAC